MKRRTFLVGTGGTAIGSTALISSGAFTGVEANRNVNVEVAGDESAFLGLSAIDGSPNAGYVDDDDGTLEINLGSDSPGDGEGVNPDAYSYFDFLFSIANNGPQPVQILIVKYGDNPESVQFYDSSNLVPIELPELGSGESIDLGIETFTEGLDADDELLDEVFILALGTETLDSEEVSIQDTVNESAVPDGGTPNTDYDGPSRTD